MDLNPSKLYKPLFIGEVNGKRPRYIICMGGRASGRSYAASQFALLHLIADKYFRCAIMRFVLSDIRNSIFSEIRDRIEEQELDSQITVKDNSLEFIYGNNKINGIGFRKSSSDQKSKLKSLASYSTVIIEEADEVDEEDFMQLDDSLRTMKSDITVILLLNPPHKSHWIVKRWFNLIESDVDGFYNMELKKSIKDAVFVHGTYHHNQKNLNQKTIDNFERYKETRPDHYYNMIMGLISEGARGRVFTDWKTITEEEYHALEYPETYGLDFGYSNDPAALVGVKRHNGKIWRHEYIYETGLLNSQLSAKMVALGIDGKIYADAAEPKSIEELRQLEWDIEAAPKGPDSIRNGINGMLEYEETYYTESSEGASQEIQNYKWALDKNKEPTNKPVDAWNHWMDAARYEDMGYKNQSFIGFV